MLVKKELWLTTYLLVYLLFLAACGQTAQSTSGNSVTSNRLPTRAEETQTPTLAPSPTGILSIVQQQGATPTPTPTSSTAGGLAPYGQPPAATSLETQLAQKLFSQINQDRAKLGLYAYTWNSLLTNGARLHSWNMFHCGFSHTCPNGEDQCARIAGEGFAGYSDCGECIGLAGPSSPPWKNVYAVQESMMNEPPSGWHRIHLTSKTLHHVGVGVYVAPNGWAWFTEDLVS